VSYFDNNSNHSVLPKCLFVWSVFLIRNYGLLKLIEYGTKDKPFISDQPFIIPREEYTNEFHANVLTTTAVESVTHIMIKSTLFTSILADSIGLDLLYFVPISFLFEIIFDLFHYTSHRALHHNIIYKYFHKKHHKFNHPIAITTFYQDPLDLILTNSIPTFLAVCMTPRVSYLQFHLIVVYKNFIEISGHSGKLSYPTSSFPQYIWLPKILHIELYTEDHDLHHSLNNCNYGKRFSLWDKAFGTYKTSRDLLLGKST
jgi:sterol desaturase/sphingolipid hydroxylase (fatty acid hydroxylase superfamily)